MNSHCQRPKSREAETQKCECHYRPNVDIYEKRDEIVLVADLPGATPDSIHVDYEDGDLSIEAKVEPRQAADAPYLVREYGTGDYRRQFRIHEMVDADQIGAHFKDGVLEVHLPKVQAAKPRRITVNSD